MEMYNIDNIYIVCETLFGYFVQSLPWHNKTRPLTEQFIETKQ